MEKTDKLVILGDSAFAEIAWEYFDCDSPYQVVAFSVEKEYIKRDRFLDLPLVPFEELDRCFAPAVYKFFAANAYTQNNKLRARLYQAAKEKGFAPASFISPHAFVARSASLGEHCFVFEANVIQPRVRIGNNVVLWSGNHIGHHSSIADHCFISSHVVISGFVDVGAYCFFGVNSAVGNNLRIGDHCTIGAGATVLSDVASYKVVVGTLRDSQRRPS